jgi:type III secretory pathway component EscU
VADEKTEQPTHHKLSEARKKGQVAKSNDVVAAFLFVIAFMYFRLWENRFSTRWLII